MSTRNHDDEHIPVARARPTQRRPSHQRTGRDASDAGLTMIVVAALLTAAGAWAGGLLGASIAGGLLGGFVGVVAGFAAIYARYRRL